MGRRRDINLVISGADESGAGFAAAEQRLDSLARKVQETNAKIAAAESAAYQQTAAARQRFLGAREAWATSAGGAGSLAAFRQLRAAESGLTTAQAGTMMARENAIIAARNARASLIRDQMASGREAEKLAGAAERTEGGFFKSVRVLALLHQGLGLAATAARALNGEFKTAEEFARTLPGSELGIPLGHLIGNAIYGKPTVENVQWGERQRRREAEMDADREADRMRADQRQVKLERRLAEKASQQERVRALLNQLGQQAAEMGLDPLAAVMDRMHRAGANAEEMRWAERRVEQIRTQQQQQATRAAAAAATEAMRTPGEAAVEEYMRTQELWRGGNLRATTINRAEKRLRESLMAGMGLPQGPVGLATAESRFLTNAPGNYQPFEGLREEAKKQVDALLKIVISSKDAAEALKAIKGAGLTIVEGAL